MAPTAIVVGGAAVTWETLIDTDAFEVDFVSNGRSVRRWLVTGTYDAEDIATTAPENIPQTNTRGGITHMFRRYSATPATPTSGNVWIVEAEYAFQVEYYELSFDTSGASAKMIQALDQGDYYNCIETGPSDDLTPEGQGTPDFGKLIGVTADSVEGVDAPISKFDFTVLIRNQFATLPSSYIDTLERLTGRCNDRKLTINWKGQILNFPAEELLFLGVPGKQTSDAGFELTLKFSKQRSKPRGTLTTADYVQPAVGLSVKVDVLLDPDPTELFEVDQIIYINGGGLYRVTTVEADAITVENLGLDENAEVGSTVASPTGVSENDEPVITIGNSLPIYKRGWRYLWTNATWGFSGGRRVLTPGVAVVNKVIPTANLTPIGIFGT